MSTAQASVPDGAGVRLVAAEHRVDAPASARRRRPAARRAARSASGSRPRWRRRRRETGARSPCGGNGISKARSSATVASASSLSCSQAASLARRSIDSVLASAPRPRGCSAPLTQTSNGCCARRPASSGSSPTKSAKSPNGWLDHVGPGRVAAGSSGRPGQRSDDSTGARQRGRARGGGWRRRVCSGAAGAGAPSRSAPSRAPRSAGRSPGP